MSSALSNPILWAYVLTLLPFLIFTLRYGFMSPWRQTAAGRGLLILSSTLTVALIQTVLTLLLGPDWAGRSSFRAVFLVGGFISGWYLLHTLLVEQRKGRLALRSRSLENPAEPYDQLSKHRLKVAIRREAKELRQAARRL